MGHLKNELLSSVAAPPKEPRKRKIVGACWDGDRIVPVYEGETVYQSRLVSKQDGVEIHTVEPYTPRVD